jgi:xanthine dehydrogenase accessory factor
MRVWVDEALHLLGREPRLALVSVVEAAGSAPREAGAKMLVTPDTAFGTIGGGALEHTCIAQARTMLGRPGEKARAQDYPLGPLLGQCCGGRVRIALDILTPSDCAWLETAAALEARGEVYQLTMPIGAASREVTAGWPPEISNPSVALLDETGAVLETPSRKAWRNRIEFARPHVRNVLLIGGGHVGAALASMLRQLPLQLDWIDSRSEGDEAGALNGARLSIDPVSDVTRAPRNSVFLIMTHSHALDFDLLAATLRRGDALYCGVIGSKTKRQRFTNRLAKAGFSETERGGFICPIGAARLAGKEPAMIALAVAMEIMQCFEAHEARQ